MNFNGKVGDLLFRQIGDQTVVSHKPIPRNPRTQAQQVNRARWLNNVSFVQIMKRGNFYFGFEEKHGSQSDTCLVQKYGSKAEPAVYIVQDMKGAAVVLTEFPISRGSLPAVEQQYDAEHGVLMTDIAVDDMGWINTEYTVVVVHAHPEKMNSSLNYTKAMTDVLTKHPELMEREIYTPCLTSVEINPADTPRPNISDYDSLTAIDGRLCVRMVPEDAACVYIKRRNPRQSRAGKDAFFYSSQDMTLGPAAIEYRSQWTTPAAAELAAASIWKRK